MVVSAKRSIVLVRFPFSDLSDSKLRPAIVLANAGRDDVILCQITSQPYADAAAVVIDTNDIENGSLRQTSFARPGKLFTANQTIVSRELGKLSGLRFEQLVEAVIALIRK